MKLSILERIQILNLLPGEGNLLTLRVVRNAKDTIGFDDEELAKLGFRYTGEKGYDGKTVQGIAWNPECSDYAVDIEVKESAMAMVESALRTREGEGKLTIDLLPLYERIVLKDEGVLTP